MYLTGDIAQDYAIMQNAQFVYFYYYYHDPSGYYYGRGSPRAPQSPFGNSPPDPLLISPQAVMSPNSNMRQPGVQQVSPQFNQVPMSSGFGAQAGPGSFPGGPPVASGAPSFNAGGSMTQSTASALHDFDMHFLDTTLNSMENKNMSGDMNMSGASSSTSQYVKQELRNICSARSEKQQQQQQQSQQQPMDFESSSSELPPEILETINDMSKEHGGPLSNPIEEAVVVSQSRLEARRRYQQFRKLSTSAQQPPAVADPSDEAEVKATSLFRNQLLRPLHNTPSPSPGGGKQMPQKSNKAADSVSQVNILQSESRTPLDDIRPADNRNSLLCQLLSE